MADYNNVAPYYDLLSGLVFGNQLTKAESFFLSRVKDPRNILIFGGGTGKTLPKILTLFPEASIYFLEASSSMISIAKKRNHLGIQSVKFMHGEEQALLHSTLRFDLVITSFVLDVFPKSRLDLIMNTLYLVLEPEGHWIQTDFYVNQKSPWWQRALVRTMYLFFRLTANQHHQRLADFDQYFSKRPLKIIVQKAFYFDMIKTILYQKTQESEPSH